MTLINSKKEEKHVLIIDFGSQYSQLISKKVRNCGIYSEIISIKNKKLISCLKEFDAFILSGSPDSVENESVYMISKDILGRKKPILGICYGMQLIHKIFGGKVEKSEKSEFGEVEVKKYKDHLLIDSLPPNFNAWMSHNDSVTKLGAGFELIGKTKNCHAIAVNDKEKIYTVQFHPETEHSEYGEKIFANFLFLICKFTPYWEVKKLIEDKKILLKEKIKDDKVLLALSGGVDSSVTAELLYASAPENIVCVFVDTGLLPKNTKEKITNYFKKKFFDNFHILEEKNRFFEALKNVEDPEEKRKKIGKLFVEIFGEFIKQQKNIKYLAQGTIYPDLIESGKNSEKSETIKTHHNTVEELKNKFELLEPISDLFKNEVREMGKELGVQDWILEQHPFPGPGLAIRISGEVTEEKVNLLREIDFIFTQKLKSHDLYKYISQAFAILLSTKSVGIKGDKRSYGYTVVLRAINTSNFMTSTVTHFQWDFLKEISSEITGKIPEVNRVLYDITSKPPATIEWE